MASSPEITVVIPLYNKADSISRAIRSVFLQERPPDSLVVVDDGSSDSSAEICRAELSEAPASIACHMLSQKNEGVSVARNVGAQHTQSGYVAFLDADDEWLPNHLAEIEHLARTCPSAGIISTRHARLNKHGQPSPEPSALPTGFFGLVENGLQAYRKGYGILHTSFIAVARPALTRSGGFPPGERKSQDMHLWLRLLLNEPFAHSDACTGIWHEEETGVVRRGGAVPAHFAYFLNSEEGRRYLSNPDLMAFLRTNMASHVGGHRLRRDDRVVDELLRMSSDFPVVDRLKMHLIARLPRRVLAELSAQVRRLRQARSTT